MISAHNCKLSIGGSGSLTTHMAYKLSIIMPVFNKINFTKSALNDLFLLPEDHQIIVVDNGSTDDTAKYLRQIDRPHFGFIRNSET